MYSGNPDDLQPLERLFLSPRPLPVVLGWVAAFLLLFLIYNGPPGVTPPDGSPFAAAQGAAVPEAAVPDDTVRIGLWDSPGGLFNPLFAVNAADRKINSFLFEGLLRYGPDLRPEPNLAASYEVLPDQRTIMFRLRDNARWHDGRRLTADDVVFTLETVLHRDYSGPFQGRFGYVKGAQEYRTGKADHVAGLVAADHATLAVTLEKPYGPALGEIGNLPIVPRHAFDGVSILRMAQAPASTRAPVGSGPFRLVPADEMQAGGTAAGTKARRARRGVPGRRGPTAGPAGGNEITLQRFDDYFVERPQLRRLVFTKVGATLDLPRLRQSGIDLVQVRWQDAEGLARAEGYSLMEWPQPGYYYIGVNLARAPLNDHRFRQALAYALDRQVLAGELFAGHATLVHAPVFPGSWAEAAGMNPYAYDEERSRQLMGEAGWRDGNGDGLVDQGGRPLVLNVMYEKGKEPYERLAAQVSEHLDRVGIRVQLQPLSRQDLLKRVFGRRDFDLYLLDWRLSPDPDASALFGREARTNAVGFRYREAQDLLARGIGTVAIENRQPIYETWTRMANEQLPYIFLFSPNDLIAVSDRLRGMEVTALGYGRGAEKWWVGP